MSFWKNPEFVRHVRAELRPARALTSAAVALVICTLIGLSSWSATDSRKVSEFFPLFYGWLVGFQFVVLTFWCASACGQSLAREREMKTYDFLRTTRLSAAELLVGKILGVPVLAYYTVGCTVPISVVVGIIGGHSVGTIVWTYLLLLTLGLFVSLAALWVSMQVEGASVRTAGLLVILPVAFTYGFADSAFPGFGAISIFPAIYSLYQTHDRWYLSPPTVFGFPVSYTLLTVILYVLFGAWLALMLVRNLKKDTEGIRLLSRWQAIGFAAFLNFLFYAFTNPHKISATGGYNTPTPDGVAQTAMLFNALILVAIGIATLAPHEKLKVWWRKYSSGETGYFSESGLPWPWLVPAALIAYIMLVAEAMSLAGSFTLGQWHLGIAAAELGVALVFVVRDILFLQWAGLTKMKRPTVKGFLFICLYYIAAGIIASVAAAVSSMPKSELAMSVLGILTPFSTFVAQDSPVSVWPAVIVGVVLQLFLIVLLLFAITARLRRPALVPALSEG